jgi:hypothetical protein
VRYETTVDTGSGGRRQRSMEVAAVGRPQRVRYLPTYLPTYLTSLVRNNLRRGSTIQRLALNSYLFSFQQPQNKEHAWFLPIPRSCSLNNTLSRGPDVNHRPLRHAPPIIPSGPSYEQPCMLCMTIELDVEYLTVSGRKVPMIPKFFLYSRTSQSS